MQIRGDKRRLDVLSPFYSGDPRSFGFCLFMKSAGSSANRLLLFFFCNNRLPAAGAVDGPGERCFGGLGLIRKS